MVANVMLPCSEGDEFLGVAKSLGHREQSYSFSSAEILGKSSANVKAEPLGNLFGESNLAARDPLNSLLKGKERSFSASQRALFAPDGLSMGWRVY
jgi:hypothetical protein